MTEGVRASGGPVPFDGYRAQLREDLGRLAGVVVAAAPSRWREPATDEGWSLSEIVAHVTEMLGYWAAQATLVAGRDEDGLPFGRTHEDPDRLAAVRTGPTLAVDAALEGVAQALGAAEGALARIPPAGWARTAVHPRRGAMPVTDIVGVFMVDHLREHTEQAELVVAG